MGTSVIFIVIGLLIGALYAWKKVMGGIHGAREPLSNGDIPAHMIVNNLKLSNYADPVPLEEEHTF